jgi:transposase
MPTNEKKPRRTFDQDFIDGAVKLVTQEGYSLAAAAKAVDVPYTTLRQWCQKQSAKESALGSPTSDKARVEQLESENRQLRKQLWQAQLEREILKKQRRISGTSRSEIRLDPGISRLLSCSHHVLSLRR